MGLSDQVATAVADLTGTTAEHVHRLGGGDTAAAFRVDLPSGERLFVKHAAPEMPGAVAAEAASLTWLAQPDAVPVPAVHGQNGTCLVTDYVHPCPPTREAAEELGRGLAWLHAAGAPAHGAPPPGGPQDAWIGLAPMRNEPTPDWPSFYAAQRIEPYLRWAVDAGTLRSSDGEVISQVCERIDQLAGPAEPPSRLHGDLWSGNVHWGAAEGRGSRTRAWLIDPAAHGGHRETDLAMLHLFGCSHLERVVAAYQEVHPLGAGWRDRIGLHQLFPLLVHTVLFGGGYGRQAVAAARSALALG